MSTCHFSCLTCSASIFNACSTCSTGLTLVSTTCNCSTNWQTQCTGQFALRELIQFLDMFIKLYIVGVMFLYVLRVRLPVSYRIWSGLNGLSLLVYNQIFYLQYQDQKCLQALSVSNGPYFASNRVMQISTSHIFPTMTLIIIILGLLALLYYPVKCYHRTYESIFQYIKCEGLHIFDCSYFLACRMMYFYIGKFIKQSSSASAVYIAIVGVYGLFILLAIIRNIYKYHEGSVLNESYQTPIYLYTLLAPASLIGLAMSTSEILLVIVYCSPFALLLLILLLNRNMKIITKQNIKFFIAEAVMAGIIIAFIYLDNTIKTYILVGIIILSVIVITVEGWFLFTSGFDLGIQSKVYPILDNIDDHEHEQDHAAKKIYGEQKDGYF